MLLMRCWRFLADLVAAGTLFVSADAAQLHERELFIPWSDAAPQGLSALLVYADLPDKEPLAVLTHGTSRQPQARNEVSPWALLPQATWFARRGWTALVVVRRGYGKSGGRPDYQGRRGMFADYEEAGEESARDLLRAIEYGSALPQVDGSRAIGVGVSTGGFATVALTAHAPANLVAAINFAGGRGSFADHEVRNQGDLIAAFKSFGKRSRTHMLWIYAENDNFFWPELAAKLEFAFSRAGGQVQFISAPAIGKDGHSLFSRVPAWSSTVDDFLAAHGLSLRPEPLPAPSVPDQPPPEGLNDAGIRAFRSYLTLGPHKAFAMSEHGFGVSVAQLTTDLAARKAVENCRQSARGEKCKVASLDGEAAQQ